MSDKALPIGIDDFEEIIKKDYYYVDKTLMVRDLLRKKGKVNLFTRPRRFGKSLNLSMLRYYFEKPIDGKSRKELFSGLKIMDAGEQYTQEQEQYPVIMMTLKSAKQPTWDLAYRCLKDEIVKEYRRHSELLESEAIGANQELFHKMYYGKGEEGDYITSLQFLSRCLYLHYGKKVIVLIDEYDVPLENAYYEKFYDQMVKFIRSLFESVLKTNECLEFSVITGCLRICKESIFTGLNHFEMNSILTVDYDEHFGFVEAEVKEILKHYHCESKMDTMKEWYDGYLFGEAEVYNPWSVVNYVKALVADENAFPIAAWSNTSSNNIVKDLIYRADETVREEIDALMNGAAIEKKVQEDITYEDIYTTQDNLWNFLFFTGYLKKVSMKMDHDDRFVKMMIPNKEVNSIYRNQVINWFQDKIKVQDLTPLYKAMFKGDAENFQAGIAEQLQKSISYMDSQEAFYHGFLLGLLMNMKTYVVKSNREAGNGRYDICIYSHDVSIPPVILELKVSEKYKELDAACDKAIKQINDRKYAEAMEEEGYTEVICYGIGFFRKQVRVKMIRKELGTLI